MASDPQIELLAGRYELREQLGAGTSGAVHRGFDRTLGREVAIKLMHEVARGDALLRFEREAKIAAALRHPDVIEVYDVGEAAGRPFLVMELVTSPTLAAAVVAGTTAPSVAAVVELGVAIASMLAAAHAAGIVHRDLKPSNVFIEGPITAPRRCRFSDFGLAFMVEPSTEALGRLTAAGVLVGTPFYMAPEQAAGGDVGPPADVYSLGCMLYELIAGRPPFVGNIARVIAGHTYLPPPGLRELEPEVPIELEQIVLAMLAKMPGERPAAGEVVERLRGLRNASRRQRSASVHGRRARSIAPPRADEPAPAGGDGGDGAGGVDPGSGPPPAVAVELGDPALSEALTAGLRAARIEIDSGAPIVLTAFDALEKTAGDRRVRLALHAAPTASVISAAIRSGAGGVARWPGPIEPVASQVRKIWGRLPKG